MTILDYLLRRRKKSASVAKERLQIILAREHMDKNTPDYLPALKKDILDVVAKYVTIDYDKIQVSLESNEDMEILEVNIALPEQRSSKTKRQAQVAQH